MTSQVIETVQVATGDGSTLGGQYGTSPESPDGSTICYATFPGYLDSWGKDTYTAELWLCDRDCTDHRRLAAFHNVDLHNGIHHQWATNDLIAVGPPGDGHEVQVVEAATGDVVHGPYEWYKIGQDGHDGRVLLTNARRGYPAEAIDDQRGIYELDCRSGELRLVVSEAELAARKIQGGKPLHRREIDVNHLQYSPGGDRIAFLVDTKHVGVVDRDGSNLEFFAGKKPMHFQWFDESSIFGHTDVGPETPEPNNPFCNDSPADGKLYRWDLDRREQVELLAGYGCHPAASPDRDLFVTEDWYSSDEIALRVYRRSEDVPETELFSTTHSTIVWGSQAHVNPAFARDGSRVYYTKPTGPNSVALCYSPLSGLRG